MKALVIAPQPFFTPRGTPLSVYHRALVSSDLGVTADLLTYGEGEDVDLPGVRIIRIPRFGLGPIKVGPSYQKLFLDVIIVIWTIALLIRHRYDFVHAHEESVFFCRYLKPIFGFRLVYDMHSSLPEQLTNYNFTRSRWLIHLFDKLEASCLGAADAVITICPELAERALPRMPDDRRHFLIENSIVDEVRLKNPPPATVGPDDLLPTDRAIIVYTGTFEAYQGLDVLIPAFAKAHQSRPDALLLLAGGIEQQIAHYRALAASHGVADHVRFTGQVPQPLARHYIARASVITSPRTEGTNTPLKIYEQLASGVPLVATAVPSHTQVLSDEVCFLVEPTPDAMAAGLLAALGDHDRRERVTTAAKALYESAYSRPAYEAKMSALLEVLQ